MRIATLNHNGNQILGVRQGDNYVDLSKAAANLPQDMTALLAADALGKANGAAQSATDDALIPADGVTYLPLVTNPPKILCCGLNYRDHAEETGNAIPDYPIIFMRAPPTMAAHNGPMILPKAASDYDYEAELAVVIGKGGRHISNADALDHVAGYSCFNEQVFRISACRYNNHITITG